jgi:hypothetical protein
MGKVTKEEMILDEEDDENLLKALKGKRFEQIHGEVKAKLPSLRIIWTLW